MGQASRTEWPRSEVSGRGVLPLRSTAAAEEATNWDNEAIQEERIGAF